MRITRMRITRMMITRITRMRITRMRITRMMITRITTMRITRMRITNGETVTHLSANVTYAKVWDVTGAQGSTAADVGRAAKNPVNVMSVHSAARVGGNAVVKTDGRRAKVIASALSACPTTMKMPPSIRAGMGPRYVSGRAFARDVNFASGPTVRITQVVNARGASLKNMIS